MERRPEFRQLLIGISTSRYLPPSGTAGLARSFVSGNKRVPAPPPMMMARVRWVVPGGSAGTVLSDIIRLSLIRVSLAIFVATTSITHARRFRLTIFLSALRLFPGARECSATPVFSRWEKIEMRASPWFDRVPRTIAYSPTLTSVLSHRERRKRAT